MRIFHVVDFRFQTDLRNINRNRNSVTFDIRNSNFENSLLSFCFVYKSLYVKNNQTAFKFFYSFMILEKY